MDRRDGVQTKTCPPPPPQSASALKAADRLDTPPNMEMPTVQDAGSGGQGMGMGGSGGRKRGIEAAGLRFGAERGTAGLYRSGAGTRGGR